MCSACKSQEEEEAKKEGKDIVRACAEDTWADAMVGSAPAVAAHSSSMHLYRLPSRRRQATAIAQTPTRSLRNRCLRHVVRCWRRPAERFECCRRRPPITGLTATHTPLPTSRIVRNVAVLRGFCSFASLEAYLLLSLEIIYCSAFHFAWQSNGVVKEGRCRTRSPLACFLCCLVSLLSVVLSRARHACNGEAPVVTFASAVLKSLFGCVVSSARVNKALVCGPPHCECCAYTILFYCPCSCFFYYDEDDNDDSFDVVLLIAYSYNVRSLNPSVARQRARLHSLIKQRLTTGLHSSIHYFSCFSCTRP